MFVPTGIALLNSWSSGTLLNSSGSGFAQFKSVVTKIKIGAGASGLDTRVFKDFTSLSAVMLGDSLQTIDSNCFYGCTSLTFFALPSGITNLSSQIFYGDTNLKSIYYKGTIYTSRSALESALSANGVTYSSNSFDNTGLEP